MHMRILSADLCHQLIQLFLFQVVTHVREDVAELINIDSTRPVGVVAHEIRADTSGVGYGQVEPPRKLLH